MTRVEDLTFKLADEALTDAEARELEILLAAEPEAVAAHVRLLEIEAALRGHRETLDLAGPTLARLRSDLAASVERGVMQRLEAGPPPPWARGTPDRSRRREEADHESRSRLKSASSPRRPQSLWNRPMVLALAASVLLFVGLVAWYFGPTMGQPVLAEVTGADISIERGTEFVPAANGMALQSADVLRVGKNASATIVFGVEQTRLELSAGTELKLASLTSGKRFFLRGGQIEAAVARQRPLQSLLIITPQAEARVLGTRFTLTVSTNATRLDVTEGKVRFTRTSDGASVKVAADRYAVAAADSELAALPRTGGLLCEWWSGVKGRTQFALREDPRFPHQPDGRSQAPDFSLTLAETNQCGVRLRGYLHPPVTGDYEFWLETDLPNSAYVKLLMSPNEDAAGAVQIATTGLRSVQATPPLPLVAGRHYFVEAYVVVPSGGGHFSITWKPPGGSRQLLTGKFLSPYTTK